MMHIVCDELGYRDDPQFDLKFSVSKRWFLLWLIHEFYPDGISEARLIPFLVKMSLNLLKRNFVLQLPGEPYPIDEVSLFCENGYMIMLQKPNPGVLYKITEAGENELISLREEQDFEKRLGLGPWSELRDSLMSEDN